MNLRHISTALLILFALPENVRSQTVNVSQLRRNYLIEGIVNGGFSGTPPPQRQADTLNQGAVVFGDFGTSYNETSSGGAPGRVEIRADIQTGVTLIGAGIQASASLDTMSTSTYGSAPSQGRVEFSWNMNFTLTGDYNYSFTGATFLDDLDGGNQVFIDFRQNLAPAIIDLGTASPGQGGPRRDGMSGSFSGVLPAGDYGFRANLFYLSSADVAGSTDDANGDLSFTFAASPVPEPSTTVCGMVATLMIVLRRYRRQRGQFNAYGQF